MLWKDSVDFAKIILNREDIPSANLNAVKEYTGKSPNTN